MITTVLSFLVVLGILIFIHELGHFAIAKFSGVGVEQFSLGFGPKLIGFTYGETEYKISILPLGGFVKMVGESVDEEVSEEDKERSFTHKPIGYRAAIVAAGPIMNLILAAVLLTVIFMIGVNVPAYRDKIPEVGFVTEDEAGGRAGLKTGDLVESVNGKPIEKWGSFYNSILLSPEKPLLLKVRRDGKVFETTLTPEGSKSGAGIGGVFPPMKPKIGALSEKYPAIEAGMLVGDLITKIDGVPITHWAELEGIIQHDGTERVFTVDRGGKEITLTIKPLLNKERNVFLIGVGKADEMIFKKYGFVKSTKEGFRTAVNMTVNVVTMLKGLVLGDYSIKTLGGPIMIAQVTGKAVERGLTPFLLFVAFLSLQLGIINLFPIPVLDGGHLVFFGIEFLRGKPLSERIISASQQVGVVMLIALMAFVTWNDIARLEFFSKIKNMLF